jgi:hypothetical protein
VLLEPGGELAVEVHDVVEDLGYDVVAPGVEELSVEADSCGQFLGDSERDGFPFDFQFRLD